MGVSWKSIVWIFVFGASTGWLVGLSTSPVVGTVITALLGLAGSAITILSGISSSPKLLFGEINPAPIALLALSIAMFATLGAFIRDGIKLPEGSPIESIQASLFSTSPSVCLELKKSSDDQIFQLLKFYSDDDPVIAALATASSEKTEIVRKAIEKLCE